MSTSKAILIVHPDPNVRAALRQLLEDQGRTILTDPSGSDLPSEPWADAPAVILMDQSYLDREGVDVLSLCRRKWNDAEIVLLPQGLETAGPRRESVLRLLGHVDRLLSMKSTRELLAVPEGTR